MEETTGAPSSFAALSPRRLRASSRDGGGVVNRPPSSLTMLLSRHTRRREVIALVSGPLLCPAMLSRAAAQSFAARKIAVLFGLAEGDTEGGLRIGLLREHLLKFGWEFGSKLEIHVLYSGAEPERIQANAAQAVSLAPDLLVTTNTPALVAAMGQTREIPIVFVNVSDPIASGAAQSLARPGGNATGFTLFEPTMGGKW